MKHLFVWLHYVATKVDHNTLECCKPAKKQYIVPAESVIKFWALRIIFPKRLPFIKFGGLALLGNFTTL